MEDKDTPDTADHTMFIILYQASKREFKLLETQFL